MLKTNKASRRTQNVLQFVDSQNTDDDEMLIVPVAFAGKARETAISQAGRFEVIYLRLKAHAGVMCIYSEIW